MKKVIIDSLFFLNIPDFEFFLGHSTEIHQDFHSDGQDNCVGIGFDLLQKNNINALFIGVHILICLRTRTTGDAGT